MAGGLTLNMIRRYPALKEQYSDLHSMSVTANYSGMPRGGESGRSLESVAIRELPFNSQREYEAVRQAIEMTERYNNEGTGCLLSSWCCGTGAIHWKGRH